jgi:D-alanyl-lipoteichoic acid acyltransferase DltB (MBOAT superfamily)
MSFISYGFIFLFIPITIIIYSKINNNEKNFIYFAILISLFFYIANDIQNIITLILSITVNWIFAKNMMYKNHVRNKVILFSAITFNIILLYFFKIPNSWSSSESNDLLLPLGISYYTFTQIAYLIDVAKGSANKASAAEYTIFVIWFPHLPAGPLLSHKEMLPQFLRGAVQ